MEEGASYMRDQQEDFLPPKDAVEKQRTTKAAEKQEIKRQKELLKQKLKQGK